MIAFGGRRIKRSILIDQSSIGFINDDLLGKLKKIDLLKDYFEQKKKAIAQHNQAWAGDLKALSLNGRHLTNIGTFRAYALAYLKNNPHIRQDLTLLVRHLQPESGKGLPLEVYAFTSDTAWVGYEGVQSDIFNHLLAVLPLFGLRAYQRNALVDDRLSF